jgi:hypothetical protein
MLISCVCTTQYYPQEGQEHQHIGAAASCQHASVLNASAAELGTGIIESCVTAMQSDAILYNHTAANCQQMPKGQN